MLLEDDGQAEAIADVGERAVCCPFRAIAVGAGDDRFVAIGVNGGYGELPERSPCSAGARCLSTHLLVPDVTHDL